MHLVGLALQIVEEAFDAVPGFAALAAIALQHPLPVFSRQFAPRLVERDATGLGMAQQIVLTLFAAGRLPRLDRALCQRQSLIGYHQIVINADDPAEAFAGVAGAQR